MSARLCIVRDGPGRRPCTSNDEGIPLKTPWYVIAIIGSLAALPLLSHALTWFPPAGAVHSGLMTVDTGIYLNAMRHAGRDNFSPFAACFSPVGSSDPTLYALPHDHLYGLLGRMADTVGAPHLLFLALSNAVGMLAYLLAAYALLRTVTPRLANQAFVLFALGGGLGGVLYLLAACAGVTSEPDFGRAFLRYFLYELSEGPRFQPWLMVGRLYYTLPLAAAFAGITLITVGLRTDRFLYGALAGVLFGLGAWVNFRLGPMALGAGLLLIASTPAATALRKGAFALLITVGAGTGMALALRMIRQNPELLESFARTTHSAAWFSPLMSATLWYVPLLIWILPQVLTAAPWWARALGGAALGYLGLFALLYAAYQVYYGTYWYCNDVSAAVRISDWALAGALPGALWLGLRRRPVIEGPPWVALWFLGLFSLAISAWGQGWFLRFSPDRFLVFLGLPMAMLGAMALQRLAQCGPTLARAWTGIIVASGLTSIGVTWLVSYGPLGFHTLQQHYSWTRYAYTTEADQTVLAALGDGVVLSPSLDAPLAGDYLALRPGTRVVYGNGTLDYSRQVMPEVRAAVHQFFQPEASAAARAAFVRTWCVDYIFCTDTTPVAPETLMALRALPWLEERAQAGQAALFAVRAGALPEVDTP